MQETNTTESSRATLNLHNAVDDPSPWLIEALSFHREEGVVSVEGCEIRYYRWGNPTKPGVVMVHGFLAHSKCWEFIAPYLAHDYHVVTFDLSGMGNSGWREEYNTEQRINELITVCHETGLFKNEHKPIIVAHSYGGLISTNAIYAHPHKFGGLVICDLVVSQPTAVKKNAQLFGAPGQRDPDKSNKIYSDYQSAKQRFSLVPPQPVGKQELFDYMAFHSLKAVEGGWQWKFDPRLFKRSRSGNKSWANIGTKVIQAPVRKAIVYGEKSALFTQDSIIYINELLSELEQPTFPIIGIPDAYHHLMLDQPIAVITTLRSIVGMWNNNS